MRVTGSSAGIGYAIAEAAVSIFCRLPQIKRFVEQRLKADPTVTLYGTPEEVAEEVVPKVKLRPQFPPQTAHD